MSSQRTSEKKSTIDWWWWIKRALVLVGVIAIICLWLFWPSSDSDDQKTAAVTPATMTADQRVAWLHGIWTTHYNRVFLECLAKQATARAAQGLPLPEGREIDPTRFIYAEVTEVLDDGTSRKEFRKVPATRKKQ